jgi:hypothetical protein
MRVPNVFSLAFLSGPLSDGEVAVLPLHEMSDADARAFIKQCARAMRSHQTDFESGPAKDDTLAAFESSMALLLEVRDIYPAYKADIDNILIAFGYPVPGN